MAERIVSPGVFTNEIDQSFLPAAIANLGAALIGVCEKGPAFIPTVVNNYTDFKITFGGLNPNYYLPYTAKSYLKNAGTATIVRVLGTNGYQTNNSILIKGVGSGGVYAVGSLTVGALTALNSPDFTLTGSDGVAVKYVGVSGSLIDGEDIINSSTFRYFEAEGNIQATIDSASEAVNAGPNAITSIMSCVSGSGNSKLEFSASSYGVGLNGQEIEGTGAFGAAVNFAGGQAAINASIFAAIFPTASTDSFGSVTLTGTKTAGSFQFNWGSTLSPTMSLQSSDSNYITNVLGSGASPTYDHPGYVYTIFKHTSDTIADSTALAIDIGQNQSYGTYSPSSTPFILSQTGSDGNGSNLFKFTTLSDGDSSNKEVKIAIANIKKAGTVAGSDYGAFDVVVRKFDDTDKRPQALESYAGCNLDPDSVNYVARKIGDQVKSFNSSTRKVSILGDYANKSKYVRVSDITNDVANGRSTDLLPFGYSVYSYPVKASIGDIPVSMPVRLNQTSSDGEYSNKLYHGIAFDSGSTSISGYNKDILPYLSAVATNSPVTSSKFGLDKDVGLTLDSTIGTKKFILGFQGGTDGFDPRSFGGPDSDGSYWGLGKATVADTGSFTNAIACIANPDEVDINMLVVPGCDSVDMAKVVSKARDTVEDRADAFYVYDTGNWQSTNADVISAVETIDSNYSSTYWPWVKIFDDENNKHVWVPPSVVVPGVIAFTDKVSHPWFAPAGLNRGGLTEVVMAKDRLTHADRDDLYDARINPIATFPGEGVVIWGQKTLQAKPSALDRVNVRRLLIKLKKFIASSSRYLVFEQNTEATRQRFLNIVNPFLESVQSNSGLTAFRVVVDETVNTPDVIDRNELKGQIFIQPARTAEFIVLDFVVMPSGATFPE